MKPKKCKVCSKEFEPRTSFQVVCGFKCSYEYKNPVKKISDKRAKENKVYLTLREVFLKDKFCPITGQKATQVHHKKGRVGKLLCDVKYWLAVSDEGHKKIELNPKWAKEQGYSLSRLV